MDDDGRVVFERLQKGARVRPEAVMFAFDLLELNCEDVRRVPLLTRKSRLLPLLKGAPAGLAYNEAPRARRRGHLPSRLPTRMRGAHQQVGGFALPLWPFVGLAEDQGRD